MPSVWAMPTSNLVTVPDAVPLWHAALTEPMACGWHAVKLALRLAHRAPGGMHAVVLGGGAIGIGSALSLAAQGREVCNRVGDQSGASGPVAPRPAAV